MFRRRTESNSYRRLLGLTLLVISFLDCALSEDVREISQIFTKQRMCPGKIVLLDRCPVSVESERKIQCSVRCAMDSQCVGFVRDPGAGACHLCNEVVSEDCSNNTQDSGSLRPYEKMPKCEGNYRVSTLNRCECIDGNVGESCERRMRDCADWMKEGFDTEGVYWIRPSSFHAAFRIYCKGNVAHSLVMRRWSSSFNFYRGWAEYAKGFGDVGSYDHWLGLNHMSLITSSGISQLCMVAHFYQTGSTYTWYQTLYHNITISDASEHFTIRFTNNSLIHVGNDLGDCLTSVEGQPFSTYDADHDGDVTTNCAQRHQSGWWMGTAMPGECTLCNPTGRLLKPADLKRTNVTEEVFWQPLGDGNSVPSYMALWFMRC